MNYIILSITPLNPTDVLYATILYGDLKSVVGWVGMGLLIAHWGVEYFI